MMYSRTEQNIVQEFRLDSFNEFRFGVKNINDIVQLELKDGLAEIFGTELMKNKTYTFYYGAKVAVFTWRGCILKLYGKIGISYIAKETPMMSYLNCHKLLEDLREKSKRENTKGPVTMIVGPNDVGKSTLCRILLNYCVRWVSAGRKPIFVNLDPGQGDIAIPGTIGAVTVDRPAEIDEGFSQGPPLIYHYGDTNLSNSTLYSTLITKMAEVIQRRMQAEPRIKHSGLIMNTCGWIKGNGYKHLIHIAHAFGVNIILVIDNENLFNDLVRALPGFVKIILLQKSGGVVERNKSFRSRAREECIREFFYGNPRNVLHPHSCEIRFSNMKLFKIGIPFIPNTSMHRDTLDIRKALLNTKVKPILPGPNILHHVLALSFSTTLNEYVATNNVAGFVCVTNIDTTRQVLTILSHQVRPLPQNIYLLSEVKFMARNN